MRIIVSVKSRARRTLVTKQDDYHYGVSVTAPPERGKANEAVVAALAAHFAVARSRVIIVMGRTARDKIIDIVDLEI